MNLLSRLFKKNNKKEDSETSITADSSTVSEAEKEFYRPDEYYTNVTNKGTVFEKKVLTFNEHKKTSIPTRNGLYVPEILLLSFSNRFPNPKNGYPGYWWFNYGIRDVKSELISLESRGFLHLNKSTGKYDLTDIGRDEVKENAYVPYMHRHIKRNDFTVWHLNQILGTGDKSHFLDIVTEHEEKQMQEDIKADFEFKKRIKEIDPELSSILDSQDDQKKQIKAAEDLFETEKNIDLLIKFWENIWASGGLKFNGSHWTFRLPDLYIKTKRYDKALSILNKIKNPAYSDKVKKYRERISKKTGNI